VALPAAHAACDKKRLDVKLAFFARCDAQGNAFQSLGRW
jgi:hypothetical protein